MVIKICGLTRRQDIEVINRHHPEYAGFVFAESRRRLLPDEAGELTRLLCATIVPVGVFVDAVPVQVAETARLCGLGVVQLHGSEDGAYLHCLRGLLPPPVQIWKALRIRNLDSLQPMVTLPADRFLLDAWHPEQAGGPGDTFDWKLLAGAAAGNAGSNGFLLAGGLTGTNVADAIRLVQPWGVDVSSGVETAGLKDEDKIRLLIDAVRRTQAADNGL